MQVDKNRYENYTISRHSISGGPPEIQGPYIKHDVQAGHSAKYDEKMASTNFLFLVEFGISSTYPLEREIRIYPLRGV